jgi:endonuclease III
MPKKGTITDWDKALQPLFRRYAKRKHPLEYRNLYQLVVMVVLSSRSTDVFVNKIAPALFAAYPSMRALAAASPEDLFQYVHGITNFRHKSEWLVAIAKILEDDSRIPATMEELTQLPGIGRKSANVIIGESGGKAEGVIVDLHVARVAPRLGITKATAPEKIEEDIMKAVPPKYWHAAGMAMTFLGREVCRPKNPRCAECKVNRACAYFGEMQKGKGTKSQNRKSDRWNSRR